MNIKVKGQCTGCNEMYTGAKGGQHLAACSQIAKILHSNFSETSGYLLKVFPAQASSIYWMFLAIPKNGTLLLLDQFLRKTWLECCGHLSMFTIDGSRYSSYPDEGDLSMKKRLDKILTPGLCFDYVYDFGSSTDLEIKVLDILESCPPRQVTLLMQNESPPFDCELCKKNAEIICSICGETTCPSCSKRHACAKKERDTYMMMPLVNSPRTGVCGYG